jgi:peroxiredoxin
MAVAPHAIGDWVADFVLPSLSGKQVKLSDTVGVPVVLVFCGDDPAQTEAAAAACESVGRENAKFVELKVVVLAFRRTAAASVVGSDLLGGPDGSGPAVVAAGAEAIGDDLPYPMLIDANGEVAGRYGAQRLRAVLLSASARVSKYYDSVEPDSLGQAILEDVKAAVLLESPRQILQQAPVVLIPDVIPPDFCKRLIDVWEKKGNQDSGFMVNDGDKTVGKYDYSAKIRRDHFIAKGTEIDGIARTWIGKHIVAEVHKAFNYEVTRLEDMKIACYDASRGGYFRPHRDNTTGATAHRRFAVSILLNDDYDGGYLRFPEYGPHLYRPKAGGAVVFGCSLLHEATDVTAGKRFVLLTFLYGDKEAKIREEYAKRSGGGYRA